MSFRPLNRPLSLLESRVLAVLIEKERTVPDSYPLTLNYLVTGCNQKTSRNPLMEVSEADAQLAIDSLKQLSLVFEGSGGRVARYEHNIARVMHVPEQASALLAVLMLRGPQTLSELRINSERLYKFADISSVEAFMHELAQGETPLVKELPRAPGMRENRWAHLLSGEEGLPTLEAMAQLGSHSVSGASSDIALSELANLKNRLSHLEDRNAYLERAVQTLLAELGMAVASAEEANPTTKDAVS